MARNYVGYVTAIHARDQRFPAEPLLVEAYLPSASAGSRVKRWHLSAVSDNREVVMVSLLRDALIHHLPVFMAVDDGQDRLAAVELRLPARETYEEGQTHRLNGRVRWIGLDEAPMGSTDRGQPDVATVLLEGQPDTTHLVLERRNPETKRAQLDLLERAFRAGDVVTLTARDYPTGAGRSAKVIVGVGLGSPPTDPGWTP